MSHHGPWSVKGIDQRARDAAREAAREEGLTLGEYLNNLLLGETATDTNDISRPFETAQPKPEAASSSLDRLTRRIEATEARSTLAITGIDQSVLGLVARLDNAERGQTEIASHVDGVIDDIRSTHDALRGKVRELEDDESSQQNLEALKALEGALGKLASHVYEENALAQNDSEAVKSRIETGLGDVNSKLEGMEYKVEETLSGAARRVEKAVEQAELRSEGAARHLSDRFATLETNVAEKLVRIDGVNEKLDAVQDDVSGALDSMEHTLLRIQERLNRAETTTDAALKSLESTFHSLDTRIETVAQHASPEAAMELRQQFERRFEGLADEVRASVASTRSELADEIERAAKSANPELFTRLESSVQDVQQRLSITEERQTRAIETVGDQVHRISQSFDQRIQTVENRNDAAAAEAVREEVSKFSDTMESRLDEMEEREATAIERVGDEMGKLAEHLDTRVLESEQRSATAIEQVGEQVARAASRMQTRQDDALKTFSDKLDETQIRQDARLSDALTNVSQRLELMQEQSSASLSPVQKAIASLATRLEAIEDLSAPPFVETHKADALPEMPDIPQNESLFGETGSEDAAVFEHEAQAPPPFGEPEIRPSTEDILWEQADAPDIHMPAAEDPVAAAADPFEPGLGSWAEPGTAENAIADQGHDLDTGPGDDSDSNYETTLPNIEAGIENDVHDYVTDLPEEPPEPGFADPVSELEHWDDGRDEVRDSDIFEQESAGPGIDEDEIAGDAAEVWTDGDEADQAPAVSETAEDETSDYISRARKAALAAAAPEANPSTKSRRRKSPRRTSGSSNGTKGSNAPVIAMASVLAISTAGVTAYLHLRGRQALPVQTLETAQATGTVNAAVNPIIEPEATENVSLADIAADENALFGTDTQSAELVSGEPVETIEAARPATVTETQADIASAGASLYVASASLPPVPAITTITLEQAAEQGNPVALFQLAQTRLEARDYAMGAALVRKSADAGIPAAQYRLAKLHEEGLGVPRDLALSRQWVEKAARGGNIKAMHDLGVFFAQGEGGSQSYAGAVEWFRKAAEFGVADSQYNLAYLYEEGLGISPNLTEALFWFEVANRQGDAAAPAKVTALRERVSLEAAQQAQRRAASWRAAQPRNAPNGVFGAQPWNDPAAARIADVQSRLNDLGYQAGSADGAMGPSTYSAISAFETANGLTQTGEVSDILLQTLSAKAAELRG